VDGDDDCIDRLLGLLRAEEGVEDAHVDGEGSEAKLCVHYAPECISLAEIEAKADRAGTQLMARYGHVVWQVDGVGSTRHARSVSGRLREVDGVLAAVVSASGMVRLEFDREVTTHSALREALASVGLLVTGDRSATKAAAPDEHAGVAHDDDDHAGEDGDHAHGGIFGENTEVIFAGLSAVCLMSGGAISRWAPSLAAMNLPFYLYLASYFFGGFFTLREAVSSVLAKRFEIDFLMLVAAAGAAALGEWGEGALLLVLFSIGHALEGYAMGRARQAIEALAELAPDSATVRRDGETKEIPVEQLVIGDIVVVKPNERMASDGFVVKGTSAINQAPVTGESVPIDKQPVDDIDAAASAPDTADAASRVFAGTINGAGALEICVTRLAKDSTLARVVQMVAEAETLKSPTQRLTDTFERIFVPCVLVLVISLCFAWLVIPGETFATSFYRAMAVLVASSPCALAIATPSAVLSGVARAGRSGVLIKGGGPLETLGRLRAIAFDKTGTLTEGRPRVTDVVTAEGADEEVLLKTALAVEKQSDHPLAAAVVKHASDKLGSADAPEAEDLNAIMGRGVKATVEGDEVYVGKRELFAEVEGAPLPDAVAKVVDALSEKGRTTMVIRRADRYLGVIGLMDTPRPKIREVLQSLRDMGIERMIMISGDGQRVAQAVADEIGIDEALGDLMPEDKVTQIKALGASQDVAMVGDGVNDAPAMANASVGVAMGAAGSDVALETADVALMSDDIGRLPFAVGLSRASSRIIRQNLFMSLGVVAVLIPATLFDLLGIGAAVVVHEGSTLVVVANALRLLAYRDRWQHLAE
jgi:Cd2+/Zn2+-exporting ATPase